MNVLVVGKGGREHALVWKLAQSQRIDKLYVAPGNPGMASLAECVDIRVDTPVAERKKLVGEIERLIAFAHEQQIDLTVVGPDDAPSRRHRRSLPRQRPSDLRSYGSCGPHRKQQSLRQRPDAARRRPHRSAPKFHRQPSRQCLYPRGGCPDRGQSQRPSRRQGRSRLSECRSSPRSSARHARRRHLRRGRSPHRRRGIHGRRGSLALCNLRR